MKLKHNTMETIEMKPTKRNAVSGKLALLVIAMLMSFAAMPVVAFGSDLLHNSTTTLSTKHGGSWGVPGGKYGEFTCSTCHERNSGNIKRIKKKIVVTDGASADTFPIQANPTYNVAFLDVRDGTSDFGDDDPANRPGGIPGNAETSTNICEACHTYDPTDPRDDGVQFHAYNMSAAGNPDHYNQADCMICHPHNQGFKPIDCTSCHGMPPTTTENDGSTTTGLANDSVAGSYITRSVTAGAHNAHVNSAILNYSFSCDACHAGYNMPENSTAYPGYGDISIGFNGFGSTSGSYGGQNNVSYNNNPGDGSLSCSTVYCHGSSMSGGTDTTPVWNDPTTATCGKCHPASKADVVNLNSGASHDQHANTLDLDCSKCHGSGYTEGLSAATGHVSGAVDWALETTDNRFGGSATYNAAISGDSGALAPSAAYGDCTNIYCHSTGQSTSDGNSDIPTYNAVTWGSTVSCGDCHAVSEASGLTSGSHAAHLGTSFNDGTVNGCGDCHTDAANDASSYNSIQHVDMDIDVANTYNAAGLLGNGYGTCSAASCHNDGTGTDAVTPRWGTVVNDCTECHQDDMTSESHGIHLSTLLKVGSNLSCGNCHGDAVKQVSGISGVFHFDGNVDVYNSVAGDFAGDYASPVPADGTADGSCAATYCHGDTLKFSEDAANVSPQWGTTLGSDPNNCDVCHGFPPVQDTSDTNDLHPASTPAGCTDCHFHVNAVGDGFDDISLHIDGTVQIDAGTSCLDCHGTAKYKDPNTNHPDHADHTDVVAFLTGKSLTTTDYGDPAKGWFDVTYNASSVMVAGCGQCHPDDQATYHLNGTVNISTGPNFATQTIPTPNAKNNNGDETVEGDNYSGGQCDNVYCHSDGAGNFDTTPPVWGGVDENLTCGDCHGNSPSFGNSGSSHGVHVVGIHYRTLYDGSNALMTEGAASNAAHGDSGTSTTMTCNTCHAFTIDTNSNVNNTTCTTCHTPGAGPGNQAMVIAAGSTAHLNGAPTVWFDSATFKTRAQLRGDSLPASTEYGDSWTRNNGYKAGATSHDDDKSDKNADAGAGRWWSYDSGSKTCSTVDCHNGLTTPAWDSAPTVNCAACHTRVPQ